MFSVLFEVHPGEGEWDNYLKHAKMLKPELEQIDGFIDNIRYGSLTREGWLLSLSSWRDEKALVRWRTRVRHHEVQQRGRDEILSDYHLRVGQYTRDSAPPVGCDIQEQRLDATETGSATTVTLISGQQPKDWVKQHSPAEVAAWLGFSGETASPVAWDVFDAVLTPGDIIVLSSWHTDDDAEQFERSIKLREGQRIRRVRVVRDYGMYDRRESPQYYPDAKGATTIHA